MNVLVADRLLIPGRRSIPCYAVEAVRGDLFRRGVTPVIVSLWVPDDIGRRMTFTAVLPGTGGQAGLGLSAAEHDPAGQAIAAATLAAWVAVAQSRTVLLIGHEEADGTVLAEADLVLVVGSGNSHWLVDLAMRAGTPAHLIDDAGDIQPEWLADAGVIAVSAPSRLAKAVITALGGLGPMTVAGHETSRFSLAQASSRPRSS